MSAPFETMRAWQLARVLAREVYAHCRVGLLAKDFGLRDQLQRAAVSVMNNLVEGWESQYVREKRQAYRVARRSCGEVRSMTYVLLDNHFVTAAQQEHLASLTIQTGQRITALICSISIAGNKPLPPRNPPPPPPDLDPRP